MALRALVHPQQEHVVVHPEALAEDHIQVRDQLRVGQHAPEGQAPGLLPSQHPSQVAPPHLALQCRRAAGQTLLPVPVIAEVQVLVDRLVGLSDLVGLEDVLNQDVAVEVEEIFLVFVHDIKPLITTDCNID